MAALEMNQSELARLIRTHQTNVSDWLNPKYLTMPDAIFLFRLPRALRCNGHWLMTGQGPETPPGAGPDAAYRAGWHAAVQAMAEGLDAVRKEARD